MNYGFKKLFKSIKFYYSLFFIAVLILFIHLIISFMLFPNEIHLIAGIEHKFEFNIPVEATILTDDKAVVNVNNQEVKDNINVNLNEPLSIQSEHEGTVNMKLSVLGIPVRNVKLAVLPDTEVIPCGMTVGVRINTEGVMVLGTGSVQGDNNISYEPSKGILKSGDLIMKADGKDIKNKEELIETIEKCSKSEISFNIKRDDAFVDVSVKIIKSNEDKKNKIGVWVRDSTQGIGTITYYNPQTNKFGALGHGILDVDTKQIMSVKSGEIMKSNIVSIKKGKKGSPGELLGDIDKNKIVGNIATNTKYGIYGEISNSEALNFENKKMSIALQNEIKEGPAKILSNIEGTQVKEYDVNIESVNRYNSDNSKGMIIKITDTELLEKTNGIVQGMSGSPIIQNNKLIGAVTHVFVQEPTKGYGIFIENMLNQENI